MTVSIIPIIKIEMFFQCIILVIITIINQFYFKSSFIFVFKIVIISVPLKWDELNN